MHTKSEHYMKKLIAVFVLILATLQIFAQNKEENFKGYLYNEEFQVFMKINFVDNNVVSEAQPIFGEMPGYFGAKRDGREWFITNAKVTNAKTAKIEITNDYGSEDLTATLSYNGNDTFTLTQTGGSRLKIAVNRKWVKMPMKLDFKRKKEE